VLARTKVINKSIFDFERNALLNWSCRSFYKHPENSWSNDIVFRSV